MYLKRLTNASESLSVQKTILGTIKKLPLVSFFLDMNFHKIALSYMCIIPHTKNLEFGSDYFTENFSQLLSVHFD